MNIDRRIMKCFLTSAVCFCLLGMQMIDAKAGEEQQFREVGQLDVDAYFFNLPKMAERKEWKKLSIMGETAIEACQSLEYKELQWEITIQMILCYSEMGDFERSLYHISRLQELSDSISNKKLVVENFCKIAAMLQAFADFLQEDSFAKGRLLNEAWLFTQEAEKIAVNDPDLIRYVQN